MVHPPSVQRLLVIALTIAGVTLAGCNKPADAPPAAVAATPAPVAAAPAPAPQPAPVYTPPTADKLYQMVAPIALYPDKLVAQVLAGATYPAQVADADRWLHQNPNLKAGPLADAADRQPWDPSIKSLTAFRSVLDQMKNNLPWTTALGEAYYNEPSDVMNAIQVMRQRASRAGQLKSTPQLKVASGSVPVDYTPDPNTLAQRGPVIVEPPTQYITIAPAQPDTVYVPAYDPERIYGEPVRVYPGYVYAPPQPVYSAPRYGTAQVATVGALTFGLGVVVGSALERHDWGWHSWGVNWGDRRPPPGRDPGDGRSYPRPAVVYNRTTYVSHSQTVSNNVHNTYNVYNNAPEPREAQPRQVQAPLAQAPLAQPVQLQHDQAVAQRMQQEQQQRQMQMQREQAQAQARQQQQQQMRQQEQARQAQARDQQMRAQQQHVDQARQAQEQGREQQLQRQQQQQVEAQQQARLQQEQRQQQQQHERQREQQQQEQARQMQAQAGQAQERQRRQAEEQDRQRQQAQQAQQRQHNAEQQAHPPPPHPAQEAAAPHHRPEPPHAGERPRDPSRADGRT